MNNTTEKEIQKIISEEMGIEYPTITLEMPPKKSMGDACFSCFSFARELKKSPLIIAEELASILAQNSLFESTSALGPYVNLKISKSVYTDSFEKIYKDIDTFLAPQTTNNQTIIIDYIGANVGKPLHIGHICTPIIGQVIVNLYKNLGFSVISDSHIGDWGIIFGKLITAYKLWGDKEKLKENAVDYLLELYVRITAEAKKNPDYDEQARQAFQLLSKGDTESKEIWAEFTGYSIQAMNVLLARLGVFPQYNVGESFYEGLGLAKMENYPDLEFDMHSIVEELIEKNIATKNDDHSVGVVFDDDTKFPSCILQKRDGTHGYLASDLACIKYRLANWNPEKIIYFVDVRQKLHFEQAFKIAELAAWIIPSGKNDSQLTQTSAHPSAFGGEGEKNTQLIHAYNGFISGKDGPFSSRTGNIIKLADLLDEAESRAKDLILTKRQDLEASELTILAKQIGIGAIKYGYLKKSRDTDIVFDWDEFMTFEGNSGPYVQYGYVRARRIITRFETSNTISPYMTGQLTQTEEINLFNMIQKFPEVREKTLASHMPHHLCNYVFDLTKSFSSLYNAVHILNEEDFDKQLIRIQLVETFCKTVKNIFDILGIELPERM